MPSESDYKAASSKVRFDQDTGEFYWLVSMVKQRIVAGEKASTALRRDGYRRVSVAKTHFAAHRLAWFLVHSFVPLWIDHINGDRADNRLCNLRECTPSQNQWNRGPERRNKTGYKGVGLNESGNRFRAYIRFKTKTYALGTFDTPEEAHAAYVSAASSLHGEFARFE
jgi:hypothetical protein